jgi:hypothetical protein
METLTLGSSCNVVIFSGGSTAGSAGRHMGMLPIMSGLRATQSNPATTVERDFAKVPLDRNRRWVSTVESSRAVPDYEDIEAEMADPEVQAALRQIGLA